MGIFNAAMRTLHTMYPQGTVERLPVVNADGSTAVPGVYVVGDLAGIPLLKHSQDSGARVVDAIMGNARIGRSSDPSVLDVAILGGGVSGVSAALECKRLGLRHQLLEASELFSTIANFPKKKPIFLYPTEMTPAGSLEVTGTVKEDLLLELARQAQDAELDVRAGVMASHVERHGGELHVVVPNGEPIRAKAVIVAIGRSGNYRKLGVPGEDGDKVSNRLHDPAEFKGRSVLVVGGGDSAAEAAIALADNGAAVTMCYRGEELSRPKPENIEGVRAREGSGHGKVRLLLSTTPKELRDGEAVLSIGKEKREERVAVDQVLALIGREAPLDFFRKTGIPIQGEFRPANIAAFAAFLLFCVFLYSWKAGGGAFFHDTFALRGWFPFNIPELFSGSLAGLVGWMGSVDDPSTLLGTLAISMSAPAFYYTLAYCACVIGFGIGRIRRRRTPYVTVQTITLMVIQTIPLFLLPEILLPLLGHNGAFDGGFLRTVADNLFPEVGYGHGREYWRAYGFILAWPLFVYNFFTEQPMAWWLAIGFVQTFVIIPGIIFMWGKGAYCGWICSCGALAETLGDAHRAKMPHGPFWSRLNMAGQVILWIAIALMVLRVAGWMLGPESIASRAFHMILLGSDPGVGFHSVINYKYVVDVTLAGVIGVGFYFWFSGRVWCRFFCPLAALMHWFAKISRFRIIPEKKKCISCNVCTSVCHQGIDVMNFANKGIPMEDPECVRCSACVQMCPTGVLQFGQVDREGNVIKLDRLAASATLIAEQKAAKGR